MSEVKSEANNEKYYFNLKDIPAAHHKMFFIVNVHIGVAFAKYTKGDKSLTRSFNSYYVVVAGELVSVHQYIQDAPEGLSGWWIASEANNKWYSDPKPTLKALKESLGI